MFVKNISQLLLKNLDKNRLALRKIGIQALEKAIFVVKPENIIEKSIKHLDNKLLIESDEYNLHNFNKLYIIGGGKATAEMALALEKILLKMKDIDYYGIINIPDNIDAVKLFKKSKISVNLASHPIPNENGFKGTKAMMEIVENSTKNDLIICLISGGGSALLPLPKQGIEIKDLQKINSLLLSSGASIHEINTLRKHISDFKGGNLAKKIYNSSGATIISLIISDVVGDDLDSIASGPTVPDRTTFKDALEIIEKYELINKIPNSIKEILVQGLSGNISENPKSDDLCFSNVHNYIIGSVKTAVQEVKSYLNKKQFKVEYFSNSIIGEAKEFGKSLHRILSKYIEDTLKREKIEKIALIGTGELTVTIKGEGIGGRNQEMLLSFLNTVKNKQFNSDFLIIAANLDGIEGNSEAMGALVDNYVLEQMILKNIDVEKYLLNNDSNKFFKEMGTETITGPTGCNVNDLILILISINL
ncbi:MAG: glycerate kinase [Promethearchaeota archaeon]